MTKSKIMTIIAAIAVFLVVVLTAGLVFSAVAGTNNNSDETNTIADKVDTLALQNVAFVGGTSGYSIQTMAATTATEEQVVNGDSTTITLKLTSSVLSEVMLEKVNVPIKWSLEFVNPNSAWASGKNVKDYVTVTPKSDFTRTVTITNLAPFGEQIRLTATMDSDSDKTASCTIDYVKRLNGNIQELYCMSDFGDPITAGGSTYRSEEVGTVTGTLTDDGTYITVESGFINLLKSYLKFDISVKGYSFSSAKTYASINYHSTYKYYYYELSAVDSQGHDIILDYSDFISNWSSLTEAQKSAVKYAWWRAYQTYGNNVSLEVLFSYSYGGVSLGLVDGGSRAAYISGECYGDGVSVDGSLVNIVF